MIDETLAEIAASAWALPLMFALVLADSFVVVLPGEAVVTAFGALAVTEGSPPLVAVIGLAAGAAFLGDAIVYGIGRFAGLERWRWMSTPRVRAALAWARRQLDRRAGAIVFTARFIPFARIAVNLAAGSGGLAAVRFLPVAAGAALAWAVYQALVGAIVAQLIPGSPALAVGISIAIALLLGFAVDLVVARVRRARG